MLPLGYDSWMLNFMHTRQSFCGESVAIVTGASSGIGAATAVKLAQWGVGRFCLTGRDVKELEKTKQKCLNISKMKDTDIITVSG